MDINVSFAAIPGTEEVLVLGAKTLRKRLDIDVTQSLKAKALASGEASVNGAPTLSGTALDRWEKRGWRSLRRISVRLSGIQAAGREAAVLEIPNELLETPISQDPIKFMEPREGLEARRGALERALWCLWQLRCCGNRRRNSTNQKAYGNIQTIFKKQGNPMLCRNQWRSTGLSLFAK